MNKKYYKILILSLALLALAISGIYSELVVKSNDEITIVNSKNQVEVVVHISGEVENEGVYNISIGSRIGELIELAGGLKEKADMTNVNLAEKLKDGQKVYIPSSKKMQVNENSSDKITNDSKNQKLTLEEFNVLSKSDLEELPGIGPVLAKNIYEYRSKNGSFMNIDDLINVSGIGEKKLIAIKECFR